MACFKITQFAMFKITVSNYEEAWYKDCLKSLTTYMIGWLDSCINMQVFLLKLDDECIWSKYKSVFLKKQKTKQTCAGDDNVHLSNDLI